LARKEESLKTSVSWLSQMIALLVGICFASGFATGAGKPHYLVTNDDAPSLLRSSVTFYTVDAHGLLTMKGRVKTSGMGIAGGYFAANRVNILDNGKSECVYASDAATGDIMGIVVPTLKVAGSAKGSSTDGGTSNGIGLAVNSHYLYASFTDSNTIGTFRVKPGCKIKFVGDVNVGGLQGGVIDGMVIRGNMMVVTYGDGSIESFHISAGTPVSNGDKQNSTGSGGGNSYPSGIDITRDGHYAIFGDVSTSMLIEVSDISSGKLTKTVAFKLGNAISSSNIMLSPDETLLYVSNTQDATITAAFFDKNTGKISKGCISGILNGYVMNWSYLGALALEKATGTGGVVYVAEYGATSSIGMINVKSVGGKCSLKESSKSPIADPNSPGLLSIGTFPPRSF
jgi:6-phosphogluconolactonase (cycloisomerase 2 family)